MLPRRERLTAAITLSLCAIGAVAGCDSEKADPAPVAPTPAETAPTFAGTVESILQNKCQGCHSAGGVAPFPLVTYDDIRTHSAAAKAAVLAKTMPPWGAFDDDSCKMQHPFKEDLRLTDDEQAKLLRWIDEGMAPGDDARRPPPRSFSRIGLEGKTDSFAMASPYPVASTGRDEIRCFPIDPKFTDDQWISAAHVAPGNPQVVHHVIVYVDPKRESIAKAAGTGSYPCFGGPETSTPSLLVAWAPGATPIAFDEGTALKIPKDAMLVMQVHYHATGVDPTTDQSAVEIRRAASTPVRTARVILAGNAASRNGLISLQPGPADPPSGPEFFIPANAPNHTESMTFTVPAFVQIPEQRLLSVGAHMHWAGVDMKIEIERASPSPSQPAKECLLSTPKYDFNWQRSYTYDAPIDKVPTINAGDKLRFTCTYNNTKANKNVNKALLESRLPDPVDIRLGEQTTDEMCLGVLVTSQLRSYLD